MKIIVDKHEYAELVRACTKQSYNADCVDCFFVNLCEGHEFMESMCEIVEDEE